MSTLRKYTSATQSILNRFKTGRDEPVKFNFIADRIAVYRAKEIRDSYSRNEELDFQLIQDLGMMPLTLVNSADDPGAPLGCKNMGMMKLPTVVDIPGKKGIWRIASASKQIELEYIEYHLFHDIPSDYVHGKFEYYTLIGNKLYTRKYQANINPLLILDNPLDGFVIDTENIVSGNLIYKTSFTKAEDYKVIDAPITHNGVQYAVGATFTAVNPDYTGVGTVQLVNQKRRLNFDDPYPMTNTMFYIVFINILTKDFQIAKQQAKNIVNNGQLDELIQ